MGSKADNPTFTSGLDLHMSKGSANVKPSSRGRHYQVLPGDKIYQAMEIEQGFMRPAILHGFGTSAKQRLPTRLAELAQFGRLPLAAALFGTVDWQPQCYIIMFSLLLGCGFMRRFHRPRSPISKWCRCLVCGAKNYSREPVPCPCQAAELKFGLPTAFTTPKDWQTKIKEDVFDVVQCAQRIYTGDAASESGVSLERPQKWAKWVFSLEEVWQDDAPCRNDPHCAL